jgi:DNA repair protein RecN (Recombination protein N)
VYQLLGGDRHTLIQSLQRSKNILDTLLSIDPNLQEAHTSLHNAHVELQEVIHLLRHYQGNLHHEPERFEWLQERLSVIHRLKRKYGNTIDSIHAYQKQIKSQLDQLINADLKIETLQEELKQATITTQQSALILTEARQKTIQNLEQALNQHLQSLNMPKAQFFIKLTPQKRSMQGDEKIEFFLIPNVGEHHIALKEGASGGEMARILLAIQTLLAGKEQVGTLIFDEVDASIGGETATRIGQKLQEIGHQHQVICITHFPQVAAHAAHHLQISKQEKDGRTMTFIRSLDSATKGHELQRMTGGKQTFIN